MPPPAAVAVDAGDHVAHSDLHEGLAVPAGPRTSLRREMKVTTDIAELLTRKLVPVLWPIRVSGYGHPRQLL